VLREGPAQVEHLLLAVLHPAVGQCSVLDGHQRLEHAEVARSVVALDQDPDPARSSATVTRHVRAKLDDLRRIESVLARLVDRCCAARGTITCPLIGALHAR